MRHGGLPGEIKSERSIETSSLAVFPVFTHWLTACEGGCRVHQSECVHRIRIRCGGGEKSVSSLVLSAFVPFPIRRRRRERQHSCGNRCSRGVGKPITHHRADATEAKMATDAPNTRAFGLKNARLYLSVALVVLRGNVAKPPLRLLFLTGVGRRPCRVALLV